MQQPMRSLSPLRSLSPPRAPVYSALGVFGTRNKVSSESIAAVLNAIIDELGTEKPTHIYLPTEGDSSEYIMDWANEQRIQTTSFMNDWHINGKRARAFRDNAIQRDSTVFLCFLTARSDYYEKYAHTLAKRGRVFTYTINEEIEEIILEKIVKASKPSPRKVEPGRKQGKQKEMQSLQSPPGGGIQTTLQW